MDATYKAYCFGRMLIDKSICYMSNTNKINNDNKEKDQKDYKTKRIYNVDRGITGSLYDLTYPATYIIDNSIYVIV